MKQERVLILSNEPAGEGTWILRFACSRMAAEAVPGQFLHVRVREGVDPLLRRPLSLHRRDRANGWVEVLYRVRGRGTGLLAERKAGEEVDIIGPLGRGFPRVEGRLCIVAGGMGVAPFGAVLEDRREREMEGASVLIGARTRSELLCVERFRRLGADVRVATDDGSEGYAGPVSGLLRVMAKPEVIFACGPAGMTRSIVRYALENDVPCSASVEERMGCGIGMCRGCVVPISEGEGIAYRRVCTDGPVFTAGELTWWARGGGQDAES